MLATMGEGSTSTSDLPLYVLNGLFDTSGKETILDVMMTTTILENFATKLTVTVGVFLIDTKTPMIMKVTV